MGNHDKGLYLTLSHSYMSQVGIPAFYTRIIIYNQTATVSPSKLEHEEVSEIEKHYQQ